MTIQIAADDPAADAGARAVERRQRGAHHPQRGQEVDEHEVVDGVVVDVGERPERHHTGRDDHTVEPAVPLAGRLDHRATGVGLAQTAEVVATTIAARAKPLFEPSATIDPPRPRRFGPTIS